MTQSSSVKKADPQTQSRPVAAGKNTSTETRTTEMSDDLQSQEVDAPSIDDEFKCLIRPLTETELQKLEDSLLAEGCRDPLAVWKGEDILLDGYNRLEICEKHDIDYYIAEIDLPDREHARLWILENQLCRRNLTEDQQAAICVEVVEVRSAIEKKERAKKAGKSGGRNHPQDFSLVAKMATKLKKEPTERTRTAVAKEYSVSEKKLRDVTNIKKDAPEVFKKIALGAISVREAKKEIKEQAAAEQPQPEKKYPHSEQFRNLMNHINAQINTMKKRHKTVAEMVEDDKWDKKETNDIAICLRSTIEVLKRYDDGFHQVLDDTNHDAIKKSA